LQRLQDCGFDTLNSETPIVPIICSTEERAYEMSRLSQMENVFVLPVVAPAVP
jgi:glycine C-acetyltransferase